MKLIVLFLLPAMAFAIPIEEKTRVCKDLSNKLLPSQKKLEFERCLEWVGTECDRIERQYHESCEENSHADNAVKYDIERGNARSCEAALMKRETHRTLCDGLRRECRENKLALGDSSVEVNCAIFRDENDKRFCILIENAANRIIAAEKAEREKCAPLMPAAKSGAGSAAGPATNAPGVAAKPAAAVGGPIPTTAHGSDPKAPAPKLPGQFSKPATKK